MRTSLSFSIGIAGHGRPTTTRAVSMSAMAFFIIATVFSIRLQCLQLLDRAMFQHVHRLGIALHPCLLIHLFFFVVAFLLKGWGRDLKSAMINVGVASIRRLTIETRRQETGSVHTGLSVGGSHATNNGTSIDIDLTTRFSTLTFE
jgi:hypothetical protein